MEVSALWKGGVYSNAKQQQGETGKKIKKYG